MSYHSDKTHPVESNHFRKIGFFGDLVHSFARNFGNFVFRSPPFMARMNVRGLENLPDHSVLIANHSSYLDPPLLSCAVGDPVYYLCHRQFSGTYLGNLMEFAGSFVLDGRTTKEELFDFAADRLSVKKRSHFGIFPEGQISEEGNFLGFNSGFIRIAQYCKVPVVPCAIRGSGRIYGNSRRFPPLANWGEIGISFGTPFDYKEENLKEKAENAISELYKSLTQ